MANLSPLPLANSLISATLNERNPMDLVTDISRGYNTPFLSIVSALNGWSSHRIDSIKYEFTTVGNLSVAALIASNSLVGSNLVLTLQDTTYKNFRVGDLLMDSEMIFGKVISASAGSVTIEPSGVALVAGTHFTAGMTAKCVGNASIKSSSRGVSSLYVTPTLDFNYPGITRDSQFIDLKDMLATYPKFKGDFWWYAQEELMLQNFARQLEQKWVYTNRGVITGQDGEYYVNGGLIWSIKNRGGVYLKSPNIIDNNTLDDLIYQVSVKRAAATQDLVCLYGRAAKMEIDKFLGETIKYSGKENTFGGDGVKGFSVPMYNIGSTNISFIYFPLLDNPVFNPEPCTLPNATGTRGSNSFFLIDKNMLVGMGGGSKPPVELFHYGQEMYYGHIRGLANAGTTSSDYMNPSDTVISSDVAGMSAHAMADNGINIVDAQGMCFFEPQA